MKLKEQEIDAWIQENRDPYIQDVLEAVKIPSVSEESKSVYPFGKNCADMLDHMEQKLKQYGFSYQNHEYYCASSLIPGEEGKKEIGLFSHVDVVPAGEGWEKDPFYGYVKEGYLVGRGCSDNKGAAFAVIYAMRFLKEYGIQLKNNVRLMFGCNEENGMADARYYLKHYPAPDLTIVPDSWWPVSCSEKGVFIFEIEMAVENGNLRRFETIGADNTVPNRCMCVLEKRDHEAAEDRIPDAEGISRKQEADGSIRLDAYGIGAHASFPDGSKSAVKMLADYLLDQGLAEGDSKSALEFIRTSISDHDGKALGIDFRDPFSGNTTHVLTKARLENGKLRFSYKICYPASEKVQKGEVYSRLKRYFTREGVTIVNEIASGPHLVDRNHPVVNILCRNSSKVLGKTQEPFSQAGGTYAWWMPNSFAAGLGIQDRPQKLFTKEGHGGAHQPDECMEIDTLLKGIKIYILSLLEIDDWLSQEQ